MLQGHEEKPSRRERKYRGEGIDMKLMIHISASHMIQHIKHTIGHYEVGIYSRRW